HVQPLALPELLALGEEELIAEADAEERAPAVEAAADRLQQAQRLERAHGVVERAVAGQHDRLGVVDDPRVLGDQRPHAETPERLLHAPEIAPAVVDDRDHGYSVPLVDGTPAIRRRGPARPPPPTPP